MLGRPLQSLEDNMTGNAGRSLTVEALHQKLQVQVEYHDKFTAVVLLIYPVLETGTRLFCIVTRWLTSEQDMELSALTRTLPSDGKI